MYVIFSSSSDADAYVASINAVYGYPCPGVPATPPKPDGSPGEGWTVTWDTPNKNYTSELWAVVEAPSSSGVPFPSSAVDLYENLPSNWYFPTDAG